MRTGWGHEAEDRGIGPAVHEERSDGVRPGEGPEISQRNFTPRTSIKLWVLRSTLTLRVKTTDTVLCCWLMGVFVTNKQDEFS